MKKLGWLILLIILIPFWSALVLLVMVGDMANDIFNVAYGKVYELSGKPFDRKKKI